jgi:potassium-transporting ATPase KdpC subunit
MIQIPRIAKVRGFSEAKLKDLVDKNTDNPIIGTQTVNILSLNLALDALK